MHGRWGPGSRPVFLRHFHLLLPPPITYHPPITNSKNTYSTAIYKTIAFSLHKVPKSGLAPNGTPTWTPGTQGAPNGSRRCPKMAKRIPQVSQMGVQSTPKGAKGRPKSAQKHRKGIPEVPQDSQREPQQAQLYDEQAPN